MCGICGFTRTGVQRENSMAGDASVDSSVDTSIDASIDASILTSMCNIIAHRGPDGEGRFLDDGIALGHRRLSLIDLEGGSQPMTRGAWTIVFNGEIYNYRELRAELQEQGWDFTTNSDTEVLLVGYIAWSEAILDHIRGMFAFVIWNAETREIFAARDFFGIKPFYYTVVETRSNGDGDEGAFPAATSQSSDQQTTRQTRQIADQSVQPDQSPTHPAQSSARQFIFGSEIKALLEHPACPRELNEQALAHYLCFQFSALQETFFRGIFKLPQGHFLRVSPDCDVEVVRYWHPKRAINENRSDAETVAAIDHAMRESVRFHNVADVEVGSFLSSGIDSSYLAACLARENPAIETFTVGFAEYDGTGARDEISWAQELACELEVSNRSHHITEEEYWQALPQVQWHMDEPSGDPSAVALWFVDKLAAQSVKAVLSGEGADEFFGGYRIYQTPLSNAHVGWMPHSALKAGSHLLRGLGMRGANYLERASEQVEDWYFTNANDVAFSIEERAEVMSDDLLARLGSDIPTPQKLVAPVYAEALEVDDQMDEIARMQYVDLQFWLVGDILLKTDKMAMAHSLESRVPFLDRKVFELANSIPTRLKVSSAQTKVTLRQAAELAIPHEWAQKEKLGFPVPVSAWLREDRYYQRVREAFESEVATRYFKVDVLVRLLDEHRRGERDNTRRIWIVYMFLVWYQAYFG